MRRAKRFSIAVMLSLSFLVSPVSSVLAQSSQSALFDRIYDGDYVWSTDFPREEALLLAYGWGLFNQINEQCPDIISQSEEQEAATFILTISGATQYGVQATAVIPQVIDFVGKYLLDQSAAATEVKLLVERSTCRSPTINRVGQNVWRMLAGRRPLHLADTVGRSTLLSESEVPIETYHHYAVTRTVHDRVWEQWKSDVETAEKLNLTVLECRYDEDPDDEKQEEQYYWGLSFFVRLTSSAPMALHFFIEYAQQQMDQAMGRGYGGVIHPYTTYGSPRSECPSLRDPNLITKEIEVPNRPEFNYQAGPCVMQENGVFICPR